MTSSPEQRANALISYLGLTPQGDCHERVKGELLDVLARDFDGDALSGNLLRLGWSEAIAQKLDDIVQDEGSSNLNCPFGRLKPSCEGLEDTKAAMRLLAPYVTSDLDNRVLTALDFARAYDDPDLIAWINENITDLNLETGLPLALPHDTHWGTDTPRLSAWVEARLMAADYNSPQWREFLSNAVGHRDHRLFMLLLKAGAPLETYIEQTGLTSSAFREVLERCHSAHGRLLVLGQLPECTLAMSEKHAERLIERPASAFS